MFDYELKGNYYEIKLDTGKTCKIATKWVEETSKRLEIDSYDTIEMWLDDNGYLDNEEQNELDKKAKGTVKNVVKSSTPKKTQRERVVKENPDKKYIIDHLFDCLNFPIEANDIKITNSTKIIEFSYNNKEFKLDLVEKRKKKAE